MIEIYFVRHVDDVDLYIAGISESHLPGAVVGPTFGCIIGKNFQRFMHGDRFWFETSNSKLGFTEGKPFSIRHAHVCHFWTSSFGVY